MPNCIVPGCTAYVEDESFRCGVHFDVDLSKVLVTYLGSDVVKVPSVGVFAKWTTAEMPTFIADSYRGNPEWQVHGDPPAAAPAAAPAAKEEKKGEKKADDKADDKGKSKK